MVQVERSFSGVTQPAGGTPGLIGDIRPDTGKDGALMIGIKLWSRCP